jgi:Zn-dependent oligopeptidase
MTRIDISFANWNKKDIENTLKEVENLRDNFYKNILDKKVIRNFENTIKLSDDFDRELSRIYGRVSLIVNLHKDKSIRDIAQKVEVNLGNLFIEIGANYDLFIAVKNYIDGIEASGEKLDDLQKYIIQETVKGYKRSGMLLPKADRKVLENKKKKLNKLSSDFNVEYNASFHKGIWFTLAELDGVPESIVNNFKTKVEKKVMKYFVTLSRGDKATVTESCKVRETREKITELYYNCTSSKNLKKLQDALKLRSEMTQMLGYATYTQYALETELINTSKKLIDFMGDLDKSLAPGLDKDWAKIQTQAKKENIKDIQIWDTAYLVNKYEAESMKIDNEKVSEYLEYEHVLETTWSIMDSIFGLTVKRVAEGEVAFDEKVRIYEWSDSKTKKTLGYSLLDLFPRDGKYGHACVTDCDLNIGEAKLNSRGLISNFQVMIKDGKYLLSHENVNTFLHEMGHMMHSMSDASTYESISMSGVSRDFVEIPSQFLENLLCEEKFLKQYTKHYKTGKVLDSKTLNLLKTKNDSFNSWSWNRVAAQASTDIEIHDKNSHEYFENLESLRNSYAKIFNSKNKKFKLKMFESQNFLGNFAHLVWGYESKYYSYIASYAYMCDVWEQFKKEGMSKSAGMKYRKQMLEIGAQMPEERIIETYLGRKVNLKAFKDRLSGN